MKRAKRVLIQMLFPRMAVVILSVPVAAVLLIYTFMYEEDDSLIAYISYMLSTYSLIIVCARMTRIPKENIKAALHRNVYIHRYLTDIPFKTHVSLYLSLALNLIFAALKMFYGVRYQSVWFGTLAVYYIMLAVMRFLLLRHINRNAIGKELISELQHYRLCGIILLLMNIALCGVVILVVKKNESFNYAGYLIYVVAMYAFYSVISATRDVVKYRKYNSPVMSASKSIKLVTALVSMLSLETAMLMQFDVGQNSPTFRKTMTAATGGGVCAIVLVIAVYMIVRSAKQLKQLRNSGTVAVQRPSWHDREEPLS